MSTFRALVVVLCMAFSLFSFGQSRFSERNAIQWHSYKKGSDSRDAFDETLIIQTQGDFDRFWRVAFGSPRAPRDIVWSRELILAVNLPNSRSVMVQSIDVVSPSEAVVTWAGQAAASIQRKRGRSRVAASSAAYELVKVERKGVRFTFQQGQAVDPYYGVNIYGGGGDCPYNVYLAGDMAPDIVDYADGWFTNQQDFTIYWQRAFPQQEIPTNISWDNEQLAVIHLGRRPTTGYAVAVRNVVALGNGNVQVNWYEKLPERVVAMHVTSPYAMVRIPRGASHVVFKKVDPPAAVVK